MGRLEPMHLVRQDREPILSLGMSRDIASIAARLEEAQYLTSLRIKRIALEVALRIGLSIGKKCQLSPRGFRGGCFGARLQLTCPLVNETLGLPVEGGQERACIFTFAWMSCRGSLLPDLESASLDGWRDRRNPSEPLIIA